MDYSQYQKLFDQIVDSKVKPTPYDNEMYLDYTKLNRSRMKRWNRQLVLDKGFTQ